MLTLYLKEIKTFLSSLQGYIISGLFVVTTALFLWVIPGSWNIPMSGYATLDGFFELAPWLYLFLIPAITMKTFAEEYRSGTIELIFTRPISTTKIILSKYLAAGTQLLIILIPTFIWFYSVSAMAQPQGNIDFGAIWGSYIALLLLGSCYAAIGMFGSSLTDNQVVAFIITLALCFFMYSGFDLLGSAPGINSVTGYMTSFGIESHYQSMSRGLIDSRDVLYFLSVIIFFILLTRFVLKRKK